MVVVLLRSEWARTRLIRLALRIGSIPVRPRRSGSFTGMTEDVPQEQYEIDCPHCKKHFKGQVISGPAARYRGFKCPHCKLFVPFERASDAPA
jgi:endogenous inhibitor of DNA gyrase (YacG/DUF329 family)